jgi:hypothetical protein
MNVIELPYENKDFKSFSIRIDIATREELRDLTRAIGKMSDYHGSQFYDFLLKKSEQYKVDIS